MGTVVKKSMRNSALHVEKNKRLFLTYPVRGLAPCTLDETEDSVHFIFDTNGTAPAQTVFNKSKSEKLRFLINAADLNHLSHEYAYDMSTENLLTDINLMPLVLLRDAAFANQPEFLTQYKALIGSVLFPRYDYDHYINGGHDLYNKDKFLSKIAASETVADVREHLSEAYNQLLRETETTKQLVSNKSVLMSKIFIPVLAILLVAALFVGGRMFFIDIPFQNSVIAASNAYIHGDHLTVQRELRRFGIDRLSSETRYFLARSYVSTEALTHVQINNILQDLTRLSEPMMFDYWILLGRLYFREAIEIAQRIGDDQWLLFAYLKQEMFVRNDLSIAGEERIALLSYLTGHIDRLNRARAEAVGE